MKTLEYSIVIPVFNEEDTLRDLFQETLMVMTPLGRSYEIIFIDDGSFDQTPIVLDELKNALPEVVRVVTLSSRSGQTRALRLGLEKVKGNVAVTLDADLQRDPADIPRLIEKMAEGYDCVCGWRKNPQEALIKMGFSKIGNCLQRVFTGLTIHDVSCALRAYRHECLERIVLNGEGPHKFIPFVLSRQGYKIGEVIASHHKRKDIRTNSGIS